ncbi:MAG: TonB family protein [Rhodospirillales bacterium]
MRIAVPMMVLFSALPLAQDPSGEQTNMPPLVNFVAPAYPRAAKESRIQGTALVRIFVDRDGKVTETKLLSGHPVFSRLRKNADFRQNPQLHLCRINWRGGLTCD